MIYENFGAQRPSPEMLHQTIAQAEHGEAPYDALRAAHACTDMAFHEPEQATAWIDKSVAFCAETTRRAVPEDDPLQIHHGDSVAAIEATFHKATFLNWRAAAKGESTTHNYHQLLEAATDTLWIGTRNPEAMTKFMEFMPVLLGARMLARSGNRGWAGRMALSREGHGAAQSGFNPNWDCGITFDNTPESFVDPLHLEVKTGKKTAGESYAAAGTLLVRARVAGIAEPAPIVLGCAQEFGTLGQVAHPDTFRNTARLDTQELNAKTGAFQGYLRDESKRFGLDVKIPRHFRYR
ncbi:MAG TPA: hypothetical protein VLG11_04590 [Candidatus Saccharimonadales bacterium]|nr:hypothetical protein [Candidatus Saccharimonadales bacterium]